MQTWPTVSIWLLLATLGRRPYFTAVPVPGGGAKEGGHEQSLYIGGMPMRFHIRSMLAASPAGLSVVNLCEEFEGYLKEYEARGVEQLRLPVVDYCSVDEESIREGVAFIDAAVRENRSVYVHCKSGIGRCAMVLVAYIARHHAMSLEEANAFVKSHRPEVIGNVAARPGVQAYFRSLKNAETLPTEPEQDACAET
ncbi:protein-tyrosine phosphatase-like protein [Baffinella frigidus]|nr:protein-tyrosine phosphatase-like protein [Cryptophyta sp. CCMP2293]